MSEILKNQVSQAALVQRVSGVLLGARDFKKLAKESVELITKELRGEGLVGAGIFRVNENAGVLDSYAYASDAFGIVERLLPAKFSQLSVPFGAKENLLVRAVATKEPQESEKLADFAMPTLTAPVSLAIQKAIGMSHLVAFPLRLRAGKIVGVLLVGFKEKSPTDDQRILLETYRLQLELAFENVIEFERIVERYKRSMAKSHEKTHEENIPTIRFTLRITPRQNLLLERQAKEEGIDKTRAIRSLIDSLGD